MAACLKISKSHLRNLNIICTKLTFIIIKDDKTYYMTSMLLIYDVTGSKPHIIFNDIVK